MEDRKSIQEELDAIGRLIDAQRAKVEEIKRSLRRESDTLSSEMLVLQKLTDEMAKLRELRRMAALKKAQLVKLESHKVRAQT